MNADWFRVEIYDAVGKVIAIEPDREPEIGRTLGEAEQKKIVEAISRLGGIIVRLTGSAGESR